MACTSGSKPLACMPALKPHDLFVASSQRERTCTWLRMCGGQQSSGNIWSGELNEAEVLLRSHRLTRLQVHLLEPSLNLAPARAQDREAGL